VVLVFVALALSATAQSLKIAWDASPSALIEPIGYRFYAGTNAITEANKTNAIVRINAGTNTTATITNVIPATWYMRATAYSFSNNLESVLSDQLVVNFPTYRPENLRTVILQWNATVTGTNWIDTGFFRIKFGD